MRNAFIFLVLSITLTVASCKTSHSDVKTIDRVALDENGDRVTLRFSIVGDWREEKFLVSVCLLSCDRDPNAPYVVLDTGQNLSNKIIKDVLSSEESLNETIDTLLAEKRNLGEYFGKNSEEELSKRIEERDTVKRVVQMHLAGIDKNDAKWKLNYILENMRDKSVMAVYTPNSKVGDSDGSAEVAVLNLLIWHYRTTNPTLAKLLPDAMKKDEYSTAGRWTKE